MEGLSGEGSSRIIEVASGAWNERSVHRRVDEPMLYDHKGRGPQQTEITRMDSDASRQMQKKHETYYERRVAALVCCILYGSPSRLECSKIRCNMRRAGRPVHRLARNAGFAGPTWHPAALVTRLITISTCVKITTSIINYNNTFYNSISTSPSQRRLTRPRRVSSAHHPSYRLDTRHPTRQAGSAFTLQTSLDPQ